MLIAALAAILGCSGCSGPIRTRIDGDLAAPSFHFSQGADQHPCIKGVSIAGVGRESMWWLFSYDCVELGQLRYGDPPTGFTQPMPAQPLSLNVQYSMSIEGLGPDAPGGFCAFAWRASHWTTQGPFCDVR
jgi:hypothetical protein